jgi:hypothetical protein
MRTMTLTLDDDDYDAIQKEIARRQLHRWPDDDPLGGHVSRIDGVRREGTILPDGDSDLVGAIFAECCRDLEEYRALYDLEHPTGA